MKKKKTKTEQNQIDEFLSFYTFFWYCYTDLLFDFKSERNFLYVSCHTIILLFRNIWIISTSCILPLMGLETVTKKHIQTHRIFWTFQKKVEKQNY